MTRCAAVKTKRVASRSDEGLRKKCDEVPDRGDDAAPMNMERSGVRHVCTTVTMPSQEV